MDIKEKIQYLAYRQYLKRGCEGGQALNDWLKAEQKILWQTRFLSFIRHPLFLIIVSGLGIWFLQQGYLKNQEIEKMKFEIMKNMPAICSIYYQEIWNEWHAFKQKTPSAEYRGNMQVNAARANSIMIQLPMLFKDKGISKDWGKILEIFQDAHYPISREGITEQKLNERLNKADPLMNDMYNRIYKEIKRIR